MLTWCCGRMSYSASLTPLRMRLTMGVGCALCCLSLTQHNDCCPRFTEWETFLMRCHWWHWNVWQFIYVKHNSPLYTCELYPDIIPDLVLREVMELFVLSGFTVAVIKRRLSLKLFFCSSLYPNLDKVTIVRYGNTVQIIRNNF